MRGASLVLLRPGCGAFAITACAQRIASGAFTRPSAQGMSHFLSKT
jgi:hypothetical protein